MMLGEVVREVVASFTPMDDILDLGDAVLDPVKTHAHSFGAVLLDCDCVVDDARCAWLLEGVRV
jgi:hypothetical protein